MHSRSRPVPRPSAFVSSLFTHRSDYSGFAPTVLAHHKRSRTIAKHVVGDYGYRCKYQTPAYSAAQISYQRLTPINQME